MSLKRFFESVYFDTKWYHYPFILSALPLAWLYGIAMYVRRKRAKPVKFSAPVVSIGNLLAGGSGKTPFLIALASHFKNKNVAVVSRGYGRKSKGLVVVSKKGDIACDVFQSGDEAMLIARMLPKATVIVSEDRPKGIREAINLGADAVFLDDGFNRVDIEKFDILLEPRFYTNTHPYPAGPLREFLGARYSADLIAREGRDFIREVKVQNPTAKMVLVTAISNPKRLEPYLPRRVIARYYFDDHSYFKENTLRKILQKHDADSILCTPKDRIKMERFKLPLSIMKLELHLDDRVVDLVSEYIEGFGHE